MSMKNVNRNMILNIFKTILSIVFPLITYPYATTILGTVNFGKVSFSQSLISYIAMIAALGISNYAIREGGFYRSNSDELKKFVSEIFTFNLITTVIAYVFLFILLIISSVFKSYMTVLIIQSLSIIFVTLGVDWLNVIFEDYLYITVRSIIVHFLSLLILFAFVRTEDDFIIYSAINVINNGIIAVSNFVHLRKNCKFTICKFNFNKHIKPIMILFSNNLSVSIYTNADITLTGLFFGDYYVGLYTIASRIYTILKQVIAAAYSVTITRLTEYYAKGNDKGFKDLFNQVINTLILLSMPITIGGICTGKYLILLISDESYLEATYSLQVLLSTLIFAVIGGALAYCLNMPLKRERVNLICTMISAVENIILNILLMPHFKIVGAAIATLISEATVSLILFISLKKWHYLFDFKLIGLNSFKTAISCIPIILIFMFVNSLDIYLLLRFIIIVILSGIAFILVNKFLKNDAFIGFIKGLKKSN